MLKFLPLKRTVQKSVMLFLVLTCGLSPSAFSQQKMAVTSAHPRILLNAATKAQLLVKKAAGDADWISLLADANKYIPGQVIKWTETSASSQAYYGGPDIFFDYAGSSWEEAAITLGIAHQLTKTNAAGANATPFSNKLLKLADVIVQAYKDYPPNTNSDPNIFQYNSVYADRHVGKTIAIIYDWCYYELSAQQKKDLQNVMTDWFNFMTQTQSNMNQLQNDPTGNYFIGHVICSAYMGYALGADNPLSTKMIDFARQRILGEPGSLNTDPKNSFESAYNFFTQSVKGNLASAATESYLGPETYFSAPQKDGIPVQGWTYGGETCNFLIDYINTVKTATGEDMLATDPSLKAYFTKTAEAIVHSYTPNRFQYDNSNDNGSQLGCVAAYGQPLRLSALLEGTLAGENVEYFYNDWMKPVNMADSWIKGYVALSWEKLLYGKSRKATAFSYSPYYPIPTTNVYDAPPINSGLHKFYMRKDWSASSTWMTLDLGAGVYDQHNHNNAGHFKIIRGDSHDGDDHLLIGANEVAKANSDNGIIGPTTYSFASSFSNVLYIDDFHEYQGVDVNGTGGQTSFGYDEPTHEEQNDNFSYFRADLTSAYLTSYSDPLPEERSLRYYYRSFLYLRNSDITLVYDKVLAKSTTNSKGQYKKHLRWHFLKQPTVNGNNITAKQDNSVLYLHTVLPQAVSIKNVYENTNPDGDPFGAGNRYIFNTDTWRSEVSVAANPVKEDFLTVLQPGALGATEMQTTAVESIEKNMEGSVVVVNGNTELVLFNNSIEKYPTPITAVSYANNGSLTTNHTLCGLTPTKKYLVSYANGKVSVTESTTGNFTSSPSGVLCFKLPITTGTTPQIITFEAIAPVTYGTADISPAVSSNNQNTAIQLNSSNTSVAQILSTGKIKIIGAGTTQITASQPGNATYAVAKDVIQTLTVNKAPLQITTDDKQKVQGAANPTFTVSYSGLVYNEDASVLTKGVVLSTSATSSSPVGDYPILATGATSNNYTINFVSGTLKITASTGVVQPQKLTFAATATTVYGTADFSPGASSDNATIGIDYTSSNTAIAEIVNGKIHITGTGTVTITASQPGNAAYSAATSVQQQLTISKAPLTITAVPKFKTQGEVNPTLTAAYTGFVYNENEAALTAAVMLSTTALTSSLAGEYPIQVYGATAKNYTITFVNGLLKINASPVNPIAQVLTFKATNTLMYGAADYTPDASSSNSNIPITYKSSNPLVAVIVNGKIHIVGAGVTVITASQVGNSAYLPATDVTQTLTIEKAPLLITADIQVKTLGSPNPPLTITYNGFVNGDTYLVLDPQAKIVTSANTFSTVGSYPITVSGAGAKNYAITYSNSTLTISNTNQLPQVEITTKDVQNIMTPNGDGKNDFWIINNIERYPTNSVKVMDRVGRIVFQQKAYDNTWNGMFNGKLLVTDGYYYSIDLGVNRKKIVGVVTIISK